MIKFVFTLLFVISAVSCSYNPDEYYTEDVLVPVEALPEGKSLIYLTEFKIEN